MRAFKFGSTFQQGSDQPYTSTSSLQVMNYSMTSTPIYVSHTVDMVETLTVDMIETLIVDMIETLTSVMMYT